MSGQISTCLVKPLPCQSFWMEKFSGARNELWRDQWTARLIYAIHAYSTLWMMGWNLKQVVIAEGKRDPSRFNNSTAILWLGGGGANFWFYMEKSGWATRNYRKFMANWQSFLWGGGGVGTQSLFFGRTSIRRNLIMTGRLVQKIKSRKVQIPKIV